MTEFVPNEVLFVRTTEEPVQVIATRQMHEDELGKIFPAHYKGPGKLVTVRRPIVSDANGISYKFFDFLAEELQTAEERAQTQLKDLKLRQALAMGEIGSLDTLDKDTIKN